MLIYCRRYTQNTTFGRIKHHSPFNHFRQFSNQFIKKPIHIPLNQSIYFQIISVVSSINDVVSLIISVVYRNHTDDFKKDKGLTDFVIYHLLVFPYILGNISPHKAVNIEQDTKENRNLSPKELREIAV